MSRSKRVLRLPPAPAVAYGDHPDQVANLHLPPGDGPWPVVVLVHGGFWRSGWDRTLMTPLARDLQARGIAAWNVEYRRVGQEGGGWPGTFLDVAVAVDALVEQDGVDTSRVATAGHSAGGHLALWAAARGRLPGDAPGGAPRVGVRVAVSLAGVVDLVHGARERLGGGACAELIGGMPDEVPERYALASPAALVPLGVQQILVHGGLDDSVPRSLGRDYLTIAESAGDDVELLEWPWADHFDVIEPAHESWQAVVDRLQRALL